MSPILAAITIFLLLSGSIFVVLGALGIVRMPDVYMRLQTTSKSVTLGASCVLLAAAIHFAESGMILRTLMIVAFLFITTPIAAHVLSRAAYLSGIPPADETKLDELAGQYSSRGNLAPGRPDQAPARSEDDHRPLPHHQPKNSG